MLSLTQPDSIVYEILLEIFPTNLHYLEVKHLYHRNL